MQRVLSGNSRRFTTRSVLQLWPPALINSIQDAAQIIHIVTAQNSLVWYWNRNFLVCIIFTKYPDLDYYQIFSKVKRPWERAERKRDRDNYCGLPGFHHSCSLWLFSRWNNLLQEIAERLRASRALLQLWQRYKDCYQQCSSTVHQREEQTNELLKTATSKDIADDEVTAWIRDCNVSSVKLCGFSQLCGEKRTSRGFPLLNSVVGVLESCILTCFMMQPRHRRDSFMSATQISCVSKFWSLH